MVGPVDVVVQLALPSLAAVAGRRCAGHRQVPDAATQQAHLQAVKAEQDGVAAGPRPGGRERARLHIGLNAVVVTIDASQIDALAALPGVVSVRPVARYHTTQEPPRRPAAWPRPPSTSAPTRCGRPASTAPA